MQERAAQQAAHKAAEGLDLPFDPAAMRGLSQEARGALLRRWGMETAQLRVGACSGAGLRSAAQLGRAAASAVAAAARVVIEKNMPPLEEHLRTIQHATAGLGKRAAPPPPRRRPVRPPRGLLGSGRSCMKPRSAAAAARTRAAAA